MAKNQSEATEVSEPVTPPVQSTWADYLAERSADDPVPSWIRNGLECAGETQERRTTAAWDKLVSTYPHRATN